MTEGKGSKMVELEDRRNQIFALPLGRGLATLLDPEIHNLEWLHCRTRI
jgi:hypothetical protein